MKFFFVTLAFVFFVIAEEYANAKNLPTPIHENLQPNSSTSIAENRKDKANVRQDTKNFTTLATTKKNTETSTETKFFTDQTKNVQLTTENPKHVNNQAANETLITVRFFMSPKEFEPRENKCPIGQTSASNGECKKMFSDHED